MRWRVAGDDAVLHVLVGRSDHAVAGGGFCGGRRGVARFAGAGLGRHAVGGSERLGQPAAGNDLVLPPGPVGFGGRRRAGGVDRLARWLYGTLQASPAGATRGYIRTSPNGYVCRPRYDAPSSRLEPIPAMPPSSALAPAVQPPSQPVGPKEF